MQNSSLAYSSIDHAGIMLLGLGFGGPLGALGTFLHMTFHSFTKPLLFLCAGNMQQHLKTDTLRRAKGGLIHVMPVTGAALLIGMLAVTGSPPFSMFQSEFIILRAAFDRGHVASAILFIIFVVAIFIGFLWHIGRLVLGPGSGAPTAVVSRWKEAPVVVLGATLLLMGFWLPRPVYALIQAAGRIVSFCREFAPCARRRACIWGPANAKDFFQCSRPFKRCAAAVGRLT